MINATNDIKDYIRDISKYPLLTFEEEVELAKKIKEGDYEAREKLINSNLRLILGVALKYQWIANKQGVHLSDLINEGNLGLIRAVSDYDPVGFNTKFSTYAKWWIRQSIGSFLKQSHWPLSLPDYVYNLIGHLKKNGITTYEQLHLPEGIDVLRKCKSFCCTKKAINHIKLAMSAMSMSTVLKNDDDQESPNSFLDLQCSSEKTPEEIYEEKDNVAQLFVHMNKVLTKRETFVLKSRFGIDCERLTLEETGDKLGVTKERVRKIQNRAIFRLRKSMKNQVKLK